MRGLLAKERMTCFNAKRRSTAYVDGRLRGSEHSGVAAHLRECDSCASYFDQVGLLRGGLRGLPVPTSPATLRTRLRILASHERSAIGVHQVSRFERMWNSWRFRLDEFMRPLTIPATGGLLSSVALFGTLALSIGQTARVVAYEVPVAYGERADAALIPMDMRTAIVLEMGLDDKGRIQNYAVRDGIDSFRGDASRLTGNNISLPKFPSVLAVAQPISGNVRISLTPVLFRQ